MSCHHDSSLCNCDPENWNSPVNPFRLHYRVSRLGCCVGAILILFPAITPGQGMPSPDSHSNLYYLTRQHHSWGTVTYTAISPVDSAMVMRQRFGIIPETTPFFDIHPVAALSQTRFQRDVYRANLLLLATLAVNKSVLKAWITAGRAEPGGSLLLILGSWIFSHEYGRAQASLDETLHQLNVATLFGYESPEVVETYTNEAVYIGYSVLGRDIRQGSERAPFPALMPMDRPVLKSLSSTPRSYLDLLQFRQEKLASTLGYLTSFAVGLLVFKNLQEVLKGQPGWSHYQAGLAASTAAGITISFGLARANRHADRAFNALNRSIWRHNRRILSR